MTITPNKPTKAASSASQRPRSSRGGSPARRYTRQEVTRNRIIAVIVLIAIVVLLASLVTCAVRGIVKPSDDKGEAAQSAMSSQAAGPETEAEAEASNAAASPVDRVVTAVADSNGVEDPWVESGRFATGDAELDQMIKDFCDSHSSPDLSLEENAFNAYCISAWYEFMERDNNQYPTGPTWDIEYAKQAINEDSVNCYEQVAFAEYVLKYFGYTEAYAEPCFILRQSGSYGDHGLLYVTDRDGRKCLCDPAFGANGWMLDADIYTVKLMDVGQDPSEFGVADFEEVVKAPWIDA